MKTISYGVGVSRLCFSFNKSVMRRQTLYIIVSTFLMIHSASVAVGQTNLFPTAPHQFTFVIEVKESANTDSPGFRGTGFFVRVDGRLFFVTAFHVVSDSGHYPTNKKNDLRQKKSISIYGKSSKTQEMIKINMPLYTKNNKPLFCGCTFNDLFTDVAVIPTNPDIPLEYKTLDIDSTIDYPVNTDVITYGYPGLRSQDFVLLAAIGKTTTLAKNNIKTLEGKGPLPVVGTSAFGAKGMSGGPVFAILPEHTSPVLIGMHSSTNRKNAVFWHVDVIAKAARECVE